MTIRLILILLLFTGFLQAQPPKLVLPIGHSGAITAIAFSNDSKKVITASGDHTAKVWDANTGLLLLDLKAHPDGVNSAFFSPDDRKIITACEDGAARVWDARTAQLLFTLNPGGDGQIVSAFDKGATKYAAFNAGNTRILTFGLDVNVKLWDGETGKYLRDLEGTPDNMSSVVFSHDGTEIIAPTWNDSVKIWDARTGLLKLAIREHTFFVSMTDDNKKMLTGSRDSLGRIWDATSGRVLFVLGDRRSLINQGALSADGKLAATVADNGSLKLWNAENGALFRELQPIDHGRRYRPSSSSLHFSSDDKKLLYSQPGSTIVWNTTTGEAFRVGEGSEWAGFSPDNTKIAINAPDNSDDNSNSQAIIRDAGNGRRIARLEGHVSWNTVAEYDFSGKQYVTASDDGTARVWDATTGLPVLRLDTQDDLVSAIHYDPTGARIVTATDKGSLIIWDSKTGGQLHDLQGHTDAISTAFFSHDGKKLVSASADHTARIWEVSSGRQLYPLSHKSDVTMAVFSTNDQLVVTASRDSTMKLWDANTGALLFKQDCNDWVSSAQFSHDGKKIVLTIGKAVWVWDVSQKKFLFKMDDPDHYFYQNAVFSPDDMTIITVPLQNGFIRIWDAATGRGLHELRGDIPDAIVTENRPDNENRCFAIGPDRKKIVVGSGDGSVKLWDIRSGRLLQTFKGHTDYINGLAFSPDGRNILSLSQDNTIKVWDTKKPGLRYSFFPVDSAGYFMQDSNGYYRCSTSAAKLLHYSTAEKEVIGFDQLDIKYNRPDIVQAGIAPEMTQLIENYRQAYLKRIRDLKIDTAQWHEGISLPSLDIVNKDSLDFDQTRRKIPLHLVASDKIYPLKTVNIWINEVPVFGSKGLDISYLHSRPLDTTIYVELSRGANSIEAAATNTNAFSSYRIPKAVRFAPATSHKSLLYFIGIGSSKFADKSHNLQWSAKDIRDLATALKRRYADSIVIDTIMDARVTVENVRRMKKNLLRSTVDDKVVVAFSGHGLLNNKYDYYLSTYNVDFDSPENNGLPYDELQDLLDSIPARRKLMFIDACNSGELDKSEMAYYTQIKDDLAKEGTKGGSVTNIDSSHIGIEQIFYLTQELFVDVRKSTGANIIAASSGIELAHEDGKLKNGVFTYCIREAFNKNSRLTVSKLKQIVEARVPLLTKGLQKPTSRAETIQSDWYIW
jgi:WD40 repeat protein